MPGSSEGSVDRLCDLCDGLHSTLAKADMLGRRCKRRSGILRTLFHLIDLNSAQLNLRIAKLCLAVSLLCLCGRAGVSACAAKSLLQGHAGHLRTSKQKLEVFSVVCFFGIFLPSFVSVGTTCSISVSSSSRSAAVNTTTSSSSNTLSSVNNILGFIQFCPGFKLCPKSFGK